MGARVAVLRERRPGEHRVAATPETVRKLIALGLGVSLFFSTECPPDERLVFLRPDHQGERAQLTGYVVCRAEQRRTSVMRAVLRAAETLKSLSPRPLKVAAPSPGQLPA